MIWRFENRVLKQADRAESEGGETSPQPKSSRKLESAPDRASVLERRDFSPLSAWARRVLTSTRREPRNGALPPSSPGESGK